MCCPLHTSAPLSLQKRAPQAVEKLPEVVTPELNRPARRHSQPLDWDSPAPTTVPLQKAPIGPSRDLQLQAVAGRQGDGGGDLSMGHPQPAHAQRCGAVLRHTYAADDGSGANSDSGGPGEIPESPSGMTRVQSACSAGLTEAELADYVMGADVKPCVRGGCDDEVNGHSGWDCCG